MGSYTPGSSAPGSTLLQNPGSALPRHETAQDRFLRDDALPAERWVSLQSTDGMATELHQFSGTGITTSGDDQPPDTHFEARVSGLRWAVQYTPALGVSRAQLSGGVVRLSNVDDMLSGLLERDIDNQPAEVRVGDRRQPFGTFTRLLLFASRQWYADQNDVVAELRDIAQQLQVKPISTASFLGTGGREGGTDLANVLKPTGFGGLHSNVLLTRLNNDNAYFVARRPGGIASIQGVFDRGVALTATTAGTGGGPYFDTYDALMAATMAAGEYGAVLNDGDDAFVRTQDEPAAPSNLTADYTSSADQLPGSVLTDLLLAGGVPANVIDSIAMAQLDTALPYPVELHVREGGTPVAVAADQLLAGLGVLWGTNTRGLLFAGTVRLPLGQPARTYEDDDLLDFARQPIPPSYAPFVRTCRLGWGRSYVVQLQDLDAAITPERRAFIQQPLRNVEAQTSATVDPLAGAEVQLVSSLTDSAAAQQLAQQLVQVWTPGREIARATVGHRGLYLNLLQEVRVRSHRYAVDRVGRVLGQEVDLEDFTVTLTLLMGD